MSDPKLSIVIAVRNDNYGGDFIERLQRCIDWNTRYLEEYRIKTEFVLVNWNPVADNPTLSDSIIWPRFQRWVEYRIIEVPPEIHQAYVDPAVRKTVPMFEFIAKNAGIRRAKGEYILCINADILIDPLVFKFIVTKKLKKRTYYRANRIDFRKTDQLTVDKIWANAFAVSLKGFMYEFSEDDGDKGLHYEYLGVKNFYRLRWERYKFKHAKIFSLFRFNVVYDNGGYFAHCLNSGDFMLMRRENWMNLKAYPEYTTISTHTDAIFTVLAHSRLSEKILLPPVFHQEHERRYTWDAIKNSDEFKDAYRLFEDIAAKVRDGKPVDEHLNKDDWGLANYELKEEQAGV